jgi:cyclophilin family peptidyl-prolyl cis-trans isomerase
VVALVLAAAGCGGKSDSTSSAAASAPPTASSPATAAPATTAEPATGADGCDHTEPAAGAAKQYDEAPAPPFDTAGATLRLKTSCGTITVALDRTLGGPVTDAVAGLVANGFYDGLTFHRVVPDFVLQGGDPAGDGSGGPGFSVAKAPPADYRYKLGDVAMAKTQAEPDGTAGSQFFVISGAAGTELPPQYAVVGHAADRASLATIARIAALAVTDGPPSEPVYIVQATVEK